MTSRSGSLAKMSLRASRTDAESSTMRIRILPKALPLVVMSSSQLLEHGGRDLAHGDAGADHRFGVAQHQVALGAQMLDEPSDHRLLVRLLEVDEDVAQEDDVDVAVERVSAVHQVEAGELHQAAQL